MSRQRRSFSAKFKSDLIIELLKEEKDLNNLAVENSIQPNLLRNWKKEFLNSDFLVFDERHEENLKEKFAEERERESDLCQESLSVNYAGSLVQKNLKKFVNLTMRVELLYSLLRTKELTCFCWC